MKANKNNISLETAKLLKDCEVESEYYYLSAKSDYDNWNGYKIFSIEELKQQFGIHIGDLPAYTWQEIEDNADIFFGKINRCSNCHALIIDNLECDCVNLNGSSNNGETRDDLDILWNLTEILKLRLQKKYDEADKYFRKNCILIK